MRRVRSNQACKTREPSMEAVTFTIPLIVIIIIIIIIVLFFLFRR